MIKPIDELARRLGHDFSDPGLFELALTHRSCGKRNNERLEFLGDSILNFVIAEALYHKFPAAREGQMSRLRARLVKGETLSEIARELNIGDYLRLGSGELKSGGFRRDSILADAVEAIIGAIYLDTDLSCVREFILKWFESRLQELDLNETLKDSKTRLQEFLQSRREALPNYELLSVEGEAHAQTFRIRCEVSLLESPTEGVGSSRRQAEQEAARAALTALEISGGKA
ncbi:ribonuclease 3 [Marinobacterium zhoushanense]|uniref:Ribonuclease 3 n=1 Tax=Marinobacterium zhoushanense TaxID=1679163 RepID=A0ABQ1K7I9_9GAMM|nr:ribonuclease III [Marinobacterium zhoushanense]GGB89068.1 ribonuclease 3 [Marinobacterium zhoushanense]